MTASTRHHRASRGNLIGLFSALPLIFSSLAGLGSVYAQGSNPPTPWFASTHASAKSSPVLQVPASLAASTSFAVTTTGDPATCVTGAKLSLRCAISAADKSTATGAKSITFSIPSTDTGCAAATIQGHAVKVCIIRPIKDLPAVTTNQVTVNGYSQTGAAANTNAVTAGDNAILTTRLDGSKDTSSGQGLLLRGVGDVAQGLSITGFRGSFSLGAIVPDASGDVIQGNFLGLTPAGVAAANVNGVGTFILSSLASPVRIGGTAAATRNVISGNTGCGINLELPSVVQGNFIGTNAAGTSVIGNGLYGICLFGNNGSLGATIGGTAAGARNVISGNGGDALRSVNDSGTHIEGNYIGTDVHGTVALPNAGDGLHVQISTNGEIVGGTIPGSGNLISGNKGNGIELEGSTGNVVEGNRIGVSSSGGGLPNVGNGVYLHTAADVGRGETRDTIGAVTRGAGNTISNNLGNGVLVGSGPGDNLTLGNEIRGNAISNNPLGISLNGEYPSSCPNGPSSGPNDFLPCPTIAFATSTNFAGTAYPNSLVDIYVASPVSGDSGHGEAAKYLGTADSGGDGTWSLTVASGAVTSGQQLTATATSAVTSNVGLETSEFSANVTVAPPVRPAVYVANGANSEVNFFRLGAPGPSSPLGTIAGSTTGLNGTVGVVLDAAGDLYVANADNSSITEYAPQVTGNIAPIATITGSNTGLNTPYAVTLDGSGHLFVANEASASITEYTAGGTGNLTPLTTITGDQTNLSQPVALTVDGAGHLWVVNQGNNTLTDYPAGMTGNIAPIATISGPSLNHPAGLAQDAKGDLLVTNEYGQSITVYPPGSNGEINPSVTIAGSSTGLDFPYGIDVDASGNIYVANEFGNTVTEYAPNANGNAAPFATISGSATGLGSPTGLAVAPPLSVLTDSLSRATTGHHYSATLHAGEGTSPYTWSLVKGELPAGLRLSSTGVIVGTPTRNGRYGFTVQVTDSGHPAMHANQTLSLLVVSQLN